MREDVPANNDPGPLINKRWLRIIIILAIGIPVILELNTLVNLVKVQFWGKDDETVKETRSPVQEQGFSAGDTLDIDQDLQIVIQRMKINVSPQQWEFNLGLNTVKQPTYAFDFRIDSLELDSGKKLPGRDRYASASWEIPNGDLPVRLYFNLNKYVGTDSVSSISRAIYIEKIPVRYDQ